MNLSHCLDHLNHLLKNFLLEKSQEKQCLCNALEHYSLRLSQTLSFKDHANLADILKMMSSEQAASQDKPFHNQIKKKSVQNSHNL